MRMVPAIATMTRRHITAAMLPPITGVVTPRLFTGTCPVRPLLFLTGTYLVTGTHMVTLLFITMGTRPIPMAGGGNAPGPQPQLLSGELFSRINGSVGMLATKAVSGR